ncbi:MAG: hypothetical protein NT007_03150 [Candidatus Kapabacteria bacterium]|nr:hypothetical protein [Candidatus Kapabacteria bacterium]
MENGLKKRKISKEIVSIWFKTVLNPIVNGLELANDLLKSNKYSWGNFSHELAINVLHGYVDYQYMPNFEQLSSTEFIELLNLTESFNLQRTKLMDSCYKLYSNLLSNSTFNNLINDLIEEAVSFSVISKDAASFLKRPPTIKYAAEYLVNNQKKLEDDHLLSPIWNKNQEKIFEVLKLPELNTDYLELIQELNDFKKVTFDTLRRIKEVRNELSLNYGVPIAV